MKFKRSCVLVTGASSGIGASCALTLFKRGAKVVLLGRSKTRLDMVKHKLVGKCGRAEDIAVFTFDVRDLDSVASVCEDIVSKFGEINYVVHAAGVGNRSPVLETSMSVIQDTMNTNFFGVVAITKALLPQMISSHKPGGFMVFSSVQGLVGIPERAPYAASKFALHGFFESLRCEIKQHGLDVLLVCPGYVRTGFSLNALKGDGAKHGIMDKTTKNGYEPSYVAEQAVLAAENGTESIVLADWKGRLAIMLHYWMPSLLTWYLSRNAKKE